MLQAQTSVPGPKESCIGALLSNLTVISNSKRIQAKETKLLCERYASKDADSFSHLLSASIPLTNSVP
jgi:hypothetical protein